MRRLLIFLAGLFSCFGSLGQHRDTLRVIVLSPHIIEVAENYRQEYDSLQAKIRERRRFLKAEKEQTRAENAEEYNQQPEYTRQMFENELAFIDSISMGNYVSLRVREYIAYRLYRPFKIKPRLVLVSAARVPSDLLQYDQIAAGRENLFIINFPKMRIYKENGELKVTTRIELYSKKQGKVLLSATHTGSTEEAMTDYPMCEGGSWECAMVNSVYPALYDYLKMIADGQ
jgi:hypothetical protein